MRRGVTLLTCGLLASVLLACGKDPGRDVMPMASRATSPAGADASANMPLDKVSKSQAAAVSQRIANTEITITYSRPVARGRELFGALVPYGQVWNPGADRATAMAVSRGITIEGRTLAAGKYSLWAIPQRDRWTIIFSRAADVFHTPYPGEAQDALRLEARVEAGAHMEALCFYFPTVEGKDAVLRIHWGAVVVPLAMTVP